MSRAAPLPAPGRVEIVTPLHRRAARDYLARMNDGKIEAMRVARRFGAEYWDGDRRYGYGGYRYDGRWRPVAAELARRHGIGPRSRVLDLGCGRAHLLHELRDLTGCAVAGLDLSAHALATAKAEARPFLVRGDAGAPLPFADGAFDLAVSLATLHNLPLPALAAALAELSRVAKRQYIVVESYRNEAELFNLQCWALTCEAFLDPAAWAWLFAQAGYRGDHEFIFFE